MSDEQVARSKAIRVRRAIEKEFGSQSNKDYLLLLGLTLMDVTNQRMDAQRAAGIPVLREPTAVDSLREIPQRYPKSIEAVARELSVYELRSKIDGEALPDNMPWGIAVAIVDHILKAGELA